MFGEEATEEVTEEAEEQPVEEFIPAGHVADEDHAKAIEEIKAFGEALQIDVDEEDIEKLVDEDAQKKPVEKEKDKEDEGEGEGEKDDGAESEAAAERSTDGLDVIQSLIDKEFDYEGTPQQFVEAAIPEILSLREEVAALKAAGVAGERQEEKQVVEGIKNLLADLGEDGDRDEAVNKQIGVLTEAVNKVLGNQKAISDNAKSTAEQVAQSTADQQMAAFEQSFDAVIPNLGSNIPEIIGSGKNKDALLQKTIAEVRQLGRMPSAKELKQIVTGASWGLFHGDIHDAANKTLSKKAGKRATQILARPAHGLTKKSGSKEALFAAIESLQKGKWQEE